MADDGTVCCFGVALILFVIVFFMIFPPGFVLTFMVPVATLIILGAIVIVLFTSILEGA